MIFTHYKYGRKQKISFNKGQIFTEVLEVVLGAEVAKKFAYKLGNKLYYLAHGVNVSSGFLHQHINFKVVGILKETGTSIDRTLHIPLKGFLRYTLIKIQFLRNQLIDSAYLKTLFSTPQSVTGALIGLRSKFSIFNVRQYYNFKMNL